MKNLINKLFYKNILITEYSGITIDGEVQEKVYLKTGNELLDVTTDQWLLCLEPAIFGIWLKPTQIIPATKAERYMLIFEEQLKNNKTKKTAVVQLSLFDKIEEAEGILLLLKVEHCRISSTNLFESFFLFYRHYKKPGVTFEKLKAYVAAYSYPRKVRLISFRKDNYFTIFPMDLVGKINGTNRYVFGLRHTNQALPQIIADKKLVVSEVPASKKEEIYKLGKHHSAAPSSLDKLSFNTIPSRGFRFPVAEWAWNYNEIVLTRTINLGSHMLMWGESQHEEKMSAAAPALYHIHFLLYLLQHREGKPYPLV